MKYIFSLFLFSIASLNYGMVALRAEQEAQKDFFIDELLDREEEAAQIKEVQQHDHQTLTALQQQHVVLDGRVWELHQQVQQSHDEVRTELDHIQQIRQEDEQTRQQRLNTLATLEQSITVQQADSARTEAQINELRASITWLRWGLAGLAVVSTLAGYWLWRKSNEKEKEDRRKFEATLNMLSLTAGTPVYYNNEIGNTYFITARNTGAYHNRFLEPPSVLERGLAYTQQPDGSWQRDPKWDAYNATKK